MSHNLESEPLPAINARGLYEALETITGNGGFAKKVSLTEDGVTDAVYPLTTVDRLSPEDFLIYDEYPPTDGPSKGVDGLRRWCRFSRSWDYQRLETAEEGMSWRVLEDGSPEMEILFGRFIQWAQEVKATQKESKFKKFLTKAAKKLGSIAAHQPDF